MEAVDALVGCVAGAVPIAVYRELLVNAGFVDVVVIDSKSDLNVWKSPPDADQSAPSATQCCAGTAVCIETTEDLNALCASVKITARKD